MVGIIFRIRWKPEMRGIRVKVLRVFLRRARSGVRHDR